jgi:hypothetical protein
MAQFLRGKNFQSVADLELAFEEFLLPKIKSGFTRHSRNWLKNGPRLLNMRACILNIVLFIFCMFWPIKTFHFESDIIYGTPLVITEFGLDDWIY